MIINESVQNGFCIVELNGRLDITNSNLLEQKLMELSKTNTNFVIDCSNLEYISSSGLRVFLLFLKKVSTAKGKFNICCLQDVIKEVFDISGFTALFAIFPTRDEALK